MLSSFPARDVEEPATKEFVRAEIATVHTEIALLRVDMAEMATRFHQDQQHALRWTIGTAIALVAVVTALMGAIVSVT
jgi:hypothetical protein